VGGYDGFIQSVKVGGDVTVSKATASEAGFLMIANLTKTKSI